MKKLFIFFTVYIIAMVFALDFGYDAFMSSAFEKELAQAGRYIAETPPMTIISEELSKMPPEDIPSYIAGYSKKYDYPIEIKKLSEMDKYERPSLLAGGEVISNLKPEVFKKHIPNTNYVLTLGPVEERFSTFVNVVAYGIFILFVMFFTFIQVLFLWFSLRKLSDASIKFGFGDFSYRIKYGKLSLLGGNISAAFNDMADRIEKLISSNKELTDAVAHELRTPLSRIRFELENLRDSKADETYIKGIESDLNELDELIGRLLTYSRLSREEDFYNLESYDAYEFLEGYLSCVKTVEGKDFSWRLSDKCRGKQVRIDAKLIEIALNNIINNGFRYCKSSVKADVECSGSEVTVKIQDDGKGINEKFISSVFKPFQRDGGALHGKGAAGFGLGGLSVAHMIAKVHKGMVSVENSKDSGAIFRFTLKAD